MNSSRTGIIASSFKWVLTLIVIVAVAMFARSFLSKPDKNQSAQSASADQSVENRIKPLGEVAFSRAASKSAPAK